MDRVEGNFFGDAQQHECLTLGILTATIQHSYDPWYHNDTPVEQFAQLFTLELFQENTTLTPIVK